MSYRDAGGTGFFVRVLGTRDHVNGMAGYKLRLLGAFQLTAPNGQRIDITSKKAIALLALLASADSGERWRAWIQDKIWGRSEEHTSELQSLMRIAYAGFCLKKRK